MGTPRPVEPRPLFSFRALGLTPDQLERVTWARRASNFTHFRFLSWVVGPTFLVMFLGCVSGVLVQPRWPTWPWYVALFGLGALVNLVFALLWTRIRGGQSLYVGLILACVVALNWLGMQKTGDHSVFLLALMLMALLYSGPYRWYFGMFLGAWAVSLVGIAVLFPFDKAINHGVLLTTMTLPSLLTGVLFEQHRIHTELLNMQLEQQNRELKEDVFRDALTGLYNRRFLREWLGNQGLRMDRHGLPLCLVMVDVDWFKRINDSAGHLVGDEVLKEVAELLTQALREGDVVARYGGEEFVIVLAEASLDQAMETMQRCLESFRGHRFSGWPDPVTFSAGVALRRPREGALDLVGRADAAQYQAKQAGRDRVLAALDPASP